VREQTIYEHLFIFIIFPSSLSFFSRPFALLLLEDHDDDDIYFTSVAWYCICTYYIIDPSPSPPPLPPTLLYMRNKRREMWNRKKGPEGRERERESVWQRWDEMDVFLVCFVLLLWLFRLFLSSCLLFVCSRKLRRERRAIRETGGQVPARHAGSPSRRPPPARCVSVDVFLLLPYSSPTPPSLWDACFPPPPLSLFNSSSRRIALTRCLFLPLEQIWHHLRLRLQRQRRGRHRSPAHCVTSHCRRHCHLL